MQRAKKRFERLVTISIPALSVEATTQREREEVESDAGQQRKVGSSGWCPPDNLTVAWSTTE